MSFFFVMYNISNCEYIYIHVHAQTDANSQTRRQVYTCSIEDKANHLTVYSIFEIRYTRMNAMEYLSGLRVFIHALVVLLKFTGRKIFNI